MDYFANSLRNKRGLKNRFVVKPQLVIAWLGPQLGVRRLRTESESRGPFRP